MAKGIVIPRLFAISALSVLMLCQFCPTEGQTTEFISFSVPEGKGEQVLLGDLAEKANITDWPGLSFRLKTTSDLFMVDADSGEFFTKKSLDRERICGSVPSCDVEVDVLVSSTRPSYKQLNVKVYIDDANDERPTFAQKTFLKRISENARINATLRLPIANDGDYEPSFRVQRYHLEPRSQTTFDLISEEPGGTNEPKLFLRLRERLNREQKASYSLTLVASDGNNTGNLSVEISVTDENDNAPEFSQQTYTQIVNEITPVHSLILTVFADDKDDGENSEVSYRFAYNIDRIIEDYFTINASTGEIKLLRSLASQGGSEFSFGVTASDNGSPAMKSEASVKITVEDTVNDPPNIVVSPLRMSSDRGQAAVKEDVSVGATVALIDVTDTDPGPRGQTSCTATSDFFKMQSGSKLGEYKIVLARALDREINAKLTVNVSCSDQGQPPMSSNLVVLVDVEDVNDHKPKFNQTVYNFKVTENREAGEPVGRVFATDEDTGENANLHFALDSNVTKFYIVETTGSISTLVRNLDREAKDQYTFLVYAFDTSSEPHTSSATVIVDIKDVNDVWPRFENSSYEFRIPENTKPNTVIGHLHANDRDLGLGGVVEYLMVNSPLQPEPPLEVSQSDGTITLKYPLDHEKETSYHFVVTAVDLGKPPRNSSVDVRVVVLDENDNTPIIAFPTPENLSVTLNLDVRPGHEIIKVVASDPDSGDNGRLSYSMASPNDSTVSKLFWINQDTGLVSLAAKLTPADVRMYNIVISVNDNGDPQQATQTLFQVEVVQNLPESHSSTDTNTTIVIIMVCVTLVVAVVVLVTLCFIKYVDKKKFESEKGGHGGHSELKLYQPADNLTQFPFGDSGDLALENGHVLSSTLQKQPLTLQHQHNRNILLGGANNKVGKKSVTFDSEVRTSDTSMSSDCFILDPEPMNNLSFNIQPPRSTMSSFKDSSNSINLVPASSLAYTNNESSSDPSAPYPSSSLQHFQQQLPPQHQVVRPGSSLGQAAGGVQETGTDEFVDVALQKHNALVRSMRSNGRRPPYVARQARGNGAASGRDTDLCSSSSMETSDSGHGGSELDVSVVKPTAVFV